MQFASIPYSLTPGYLNCLFLLIFCFASIFFSFILTCIIFKNNIVFYKIFFISFATFSFFLFSSYFFFLSFFFFLVN